MARQLTRDLVIAAGMDVVKHSGWSALSLRTVANEVGVSAMALYHHIAGSDALKAAVVEAIIEISATVTPTGQTRIALGA
jgi:TetR/AcrR family transcriptional regulator, tetracycline repressor protein